MPYTLESGPSVSNVIALNAYNRSRDRVAVAGPEGVTYVVFCLDASTSLDLLNADGSAAGVQLLGPTVNYNGRHMFLIKYAQQGTVEWNARIATQEGSFEAIRLKVNHLTGNVFVSFTANGILPAVFGADEIEFTGHQRDTTASFCATLAVQYSPDGTPTTVFVLENCIENSGISADASGNVYIAANLQRSTTCRVDAAPPPPPPSESAVLLGPVTTSTWGACVIFKFNANRALQWVRPIRNAVMYSRSIAVNPDTGDVYVPVRYLANAAVIMTPSSTDVYPLRPPDDAYSWLVAVLKLSSAGTPMWHACSSDNINMDVVFDATKGKLYLALNSAMWTPTLYWIEPDGSTQTLVSGFASNAPFVLLLQLQSDTGYLVWCALTQYGRSQEGIMTLDRRGNVILQLQYDSRSGWTPSSNYNSLGVRALNADGSIGAQFPALDDVMAITRVAYVSYDPTGNVIWSKCVVQQGGCITISAAPDSDSVVSVFTADEETNALTFTDGQSSVPALVSYGDTILVRIDYVLAYTATTTTALDGQAALSVMPPASACECIRRHSVLRPMARQRIFEAGNILVSGTLYDRIFSPDAQIWLQLQLDGNLVLYNADGQALWAATWDDGAHNNDVARRSFRAPYRMYLHPDSGQLAVYDATGAPLWWSGVVARQARITNNGKLELLDADTNVAWSRPL